MADWAAIGIGLGYDEIRFGRTSQEWLDAGTALRDQVRDGLAGIATDVEAVGSSSVRGLLAKPIIDLAVGLAADQPIEPVTQRLEAAGWIDRGDAGDDGGQVFVLETRPWFRVAHLHVVAYDGTQWRNYLRFRELLRRSPGARERYEAIKRELADRDATDRKAYTSGKTDVVTSLLDDA